MWQNTDILEDTGMLLHHYMASQFRRPQLSQIEGVIEEDAKENI
jgi:hypothetical protein